MDKEIVMNKANRLSLAAVVALTAATMIGCNGNTFKRQTNPVKDYASVLTDARPYNPNEKDPAQINTQPPPDNTQFTCSDPFKISVERDRGNKLIDFTEDVENTYVINVRSLYDGGLAWDVKPIQMPANASFHQISKNGNVASYQFTWKPKKGLRSDTELLVLRYISIAESKCESGPITDAINLKINKNQNLPTVAIYGLPAADQTLTYGQSIPFQVRVNDPAATEQAGPVLQPPAFSADMTSGERTVLNGASAATCPKSGRLEKGTWVFDCKFDSSAIGTSKGLSGTVDALFTVTAVSSRSGNQSAPQPGYVHLAFAQTQAAADNHDQAQDYGPAGKQISNNIPIPTPRPDPNDTSAGEQK